MKLKKSTYLAIPAGLKPWMLPQSAGSAAEMPKSFPKAARSSRTRETRFSASAFEVVGNSQSRSTPWKELVSMKDLRDEMNADRELDEAAIEDQVSVEKLPPPMAIHVCSELLCKAVN